MIAVGSQVCVAIRPELKGVVIAVLPSVAGVHRYVVFHGSNFTQTYYEDQIILDEIKQISPDETDLQSFLNRYAQIKFSIKAESSLFALNAGNIKFIPFQFRPLARILKNDRPRLLIADEVGVGKTIESGLILKEFEKRDNISRIVIVCPKELTYKWRAEMRNRFDEVFEILNASRLNYCIEELKHEGEWPPECNKCIIGLEMVRREETLEKLIGLSEPPRFDMLILDEAHHVINTSSHSHQAAEFFAENSDIAVFLSATPLQLRSEDLFNLLHLLEPEEYVEAGTFYQMAEPNRYINQAVRLIRKAKDADWQLCAARELQSACCNNWAESALGNNSVLQRWHSRLVDTTAPLSNEERVSAIHAIEGLNTFSRIINRTKRKDIGAFTLREPITVVVDYCPSEREFYNAVTTFRQAALSARYGEQIANLVMSTIERQITSSIPAFVSLLDRFIERGQIDFSETNEYADYDIDYIDVDPELVIPSPEELRYLAEQLPERDRKAENLISIIDETVHNTDAGKLLVFSFFKHTLRYLYRQIKQAGYRVEIITGDIIDEERDILRKRFRLNKSDPDALDVLLCSEVGCEGLDYEFCSRMVNYDIPWNPMKIEQRIGRIDRFGQVSPKVQIYNFITNDTVEEKVFFRCFERLGVFSNTVGDLEGILGELSAELTQAAMDMTLSEEQLEIVTLQLADNAIRLIDEQREFEEESKELFVMDVQEQEAVLSEQKASQAQLAARFVMNYLEEEYPSINCRNVGHYTLNIRITKEIRESLVDNLNAFVRQRIIDRNSRQLRVLMDALTSEERVLLLSFNSDERDDQSIFVDIGHPLMTLALRHTEERNTPMYVSLSTKSETIPKGLYQFACCKWQCYSYHQSDDIRVFLVNEHSCETVYINTVDFENLILSANEFSSVSNHSYQELEELILKKQTEEKAQLIAENEDIVSRKIATISNYYTNRIQSIKRRLEKNSSAKIRRMLNGSISRLQSQWEELQNAIEQKRNADILVEAFAYGTIEVK